MDTETDNPVTALQKLWPSFADFAADVGVSEGAAQVMRSRKTIHPDHFPAILRSARARRIKGVNYTRLYGLRGVEA